MCLYFTHALKNGKFEAVYSGRFGFVLGLDHKAALDFVNAENFESKDNKALHEEFMHSTVFMKCRTGLALSGLRWFARLTWLTIHSRTLVEKYYELRTLFYAHMYELHEMAVADIDKDYTSEIADRDIDVLSAWRDHLSASGMLLLKIILPVLVMMGRVTSKDFAVFSLELGEDGSLKEASFSRGGLFNDIGTDPDRKLDAVLNLLRLEVVFKETKKTSLEWLASKFSAEKRMWHVVAEKHANNDALSKAYPDFESYVLRAVPFALLWSLSSESVHREMLCALACEPHDQGHFDRIMNHVDSRLDKAINFFYLHGN